MRSLSKMVCLLLSFAALAGCNGSGGGTAVTGEMVAKVALPSATITTATEIAGDLMLTDLPESVLVWRDGKPVTDFQINDDGSVQLQAKPGETVRVQATFWGRHRNTQLVNSCRVTLTGTAVVSGASVPIKLAVTDVSDEDPTLVAAEGAAGACVAGDCRAIMDTTLPVPESGADWAVVGALALDRSTSTEGATVSADADGDLLVQVLRAASSSTIGSATSESISPGRYRYSFVVQNTGSQPATVLSEASATGDTASSPLTLTVAPGETATFTSAFDPATIGSYQFMVGLGAADPGTSLVIGKVIVEKSAGVDDAAPAGWILKVRGPGMQHWPLPTQYSSDSENWLARDLSHGGRYRQGAYHLGIDLSAPVGTPVYAIDNGKVVGISGSWSQNGEAWGVGNCGVMIEHLNRDGKKFLAVYGQIRTNIKLGATVAAGDCIGTVGPDSLGSHLHLGIRKARAVPRSNWGNMPNSAWNDGNGFSDPLQYLKENYPDLVAE